MATNEQNIIRPTPSHTTMPVSLPQHFRDRYRSVDQWCNQVQLAVQALQTQVKELQAKLDDTSDS